MFIAVKHSNNEITNLEVISKRPVSQHLKECVMVDIFTNIIEIVVFTTCSDTFLRISYSLVFGHFRVWICNSKKRWLKLKNCKGIKVLYIELRMTKACSLIEKITQS